MATFIHNITFAFRLVLGSKFSVQIVPVSIQGDEV